MVYTNRISLEKLRSLDTSTMVSSSTYYNIGTALAFPSFKLKIVNNSNVLVTISIDGVSDYDVVPGGSFVLYDNSQAQMSTASMPCIPAGTQFSAKAASAGTGLLYLVTQYLLEA